MRAGCKILVTGASGILGRTLMRRLAGRYWPTGVSRRGLDGNLAADLSDPAAVQKIFADKNPEVVIHCAAYSDVDGCERDPDEAHRSNAVSTRHLAEASARGGAVFIYMSTDYVFSGQAAKPYSELDEPSPVNIYGMTKLEGECHALAFSKRSAIIRTSWLFGDGNPKNFVTVMLGKLRNEPVVNVLDDQIDAPTYVEDLARAIELIAKRLYDGEDVGGVYQFCNKGETTRHAMTVKIAEILGIQTKVGVMDRAAFANRPAVRPRYGVMSTRRYELLTGAPVRAWEDSLKEYLETIA